MANQQSLFPKALNFGETKDPIRSLWRNVLIVALEEEFSIRFRDEQLEELISIELIELSIKELL